MFISMAISDNTDNHTSPAFQVHSPQNTTCDPDLAQKLIVVLTFLIDDREILKKRKKRVTFIS